MKKVLAYGGLFLVAGIAGFIDASVQLYLDEALPETEDVKGAGLIKSFGKGVICGAASGVAGLTSFVGLGGCQLIALASKK